MKDIHDKIIIKRPLKILDYVDTKEHLVDLFNYINQLQSNWNSLREWIEDLYNKGYDIKIVLDKMNELESGDNK